LDPQETPAQGSEGGQDLQEVHLPQELVESQPQSQDLSATSQSGLPAQEVQIPQELVEAQP